MTMEASLVWWFTVSRPNQMQSNSTVPYVQGVTNKGWSKVAFNSVCLWISSYLLAAGASVRLVFIEFLIPFQISANEIRRTTQWDFIWKKWRQLAQIYSYRNISDRRVSKLEMTPLRRGLTNPIEFNFPNYRFGSIRIISEALHLLQRGCSTGQTK